MTDPANPVALDPVVPHTSSICPTHLPWKVVLDTGAVLQATLNYAGPASRLLDLLDRGEIVVCISPAIRAEYEAILRRDSLRQRFPQLTEERISAILTRFDEKAVFVQPVPRRLRFARDPNDEHVLNLAVQAGAAYIVARDRDLLDIGDSLRGVRVCDPVTFLQEYAATARRIPESRSAPAEDLPNPEPDRSAQP